MTDSDHCLNCDQPMHGPICAQCGQKRASPLALRRVFSDSWSHAAELDYRFVHALRDLMIRPGAMILGYIDGKRIPYTNPLKLLFFVSTAYFLAIHLLDIQVGAFGGNSNEAKAGQAVAAFLNYLIFLFLLPTSLVFKWIFASRKSRRAMNWAESYVAICYIWSGYLFTAVILAVLSYPWSEYYVFFRTGLGFSYVVYATQQMFGLGWFTASWNSLAFFVGYIICASVVMALVAIVARVVGFAPLALQFGSS